MDTVAVIMATFNGEKYVREQLESLANQTYKNITVYIHDDFSEDGTVGIIKDFIEANKTEVRFVLWEEKKLGYPQCFIKTLLTVPKADYYAFSDQDDIWFPDKIEKAVCGIKSYEKKLKPTLYYSCVDYYDGQLNFMRRARFIDEKNPLRECNLQEMLLGGEAMGMTFLFNECVRDVFKEVYNNGRTDFKDTFIKIYCAACGKVIYRSEPSAKYRRHNNATTVGMNPGGKAKRIINMAKKIFIEPDGMDSIQSSVDYIYQEFSDRVLVENISLIKSFSSPNTFRKKLKKVFWPGRFRKKILDEIGYRVAFLMGRI